MKHMLTFRFSPEAHGSRNEAITRFKKADGKPPTGVRLLGRWTAADFSGGYVLLETDDATALTEFSLRWSDVTDLKVVPIVEDGELLEALQRSGW